MRHGLRHLRRTRYAASRTPAGASTALRWIGCVPVWVSSVLTLVFKDGAAEKVAGGAGVGHRIGVVDAEDQGD